jgi:superfamily II DNA or RNA helicase
LELTDNLTAQKQNKTQLLEHFYEHLSENDWLDGVDLYQAGRVTSGPPMHGLLIGKVAAHNDAKAEVRVKIHPSGTVIQWIECTCSKNRKLGVYCEHIAAFMLHVDREKSEFVSRLDLKMPLKPPTPQKLGKKALNSPDRLTKDPAGASQTLLQHLQGSIHSISLLAHGPTIRVRIEIKQGTVTHYDLDLDSAAKFLSANPSSPGATDEIKALSVYEEKAELGTRFYEDGPEKIVAERVIAIKLLRKPTKIQMEAIKIPTVLQEGRRVSVENLEGEKGLFLFIPIRSANKYLGKEFFFVPGRGYWPLDRSSTKDAWSEMPLAKTFSDDDAARLVEGNFSDFLAAGPIWLDKKVKANKILEAPTLSEVKVLSSENGWFYLDPKYGKGSSSVSMAKLRSEFRSNRREYYKSGDHWLKIPEFVTQHDWEVDESRELLKVDALGMMRIKASLGDFDQFVGSKTMLDKIREGLEFSDKALTPTINHTKLDLRGYQETGLKWLWWLYRNNLHGLLADEMGLGKTHQAMAMLSALQSETSAPRKFLVICPTSVLEHWEDKILAFAPNLKPIIFHGAKRGGLYDTFLQDRSTLLTSYGVLLRDNKKLAETNWDCVILDEAHYVKNNNTATYKAACRIPARMRICLTGTPMENHLGELKNLFDFLVPGYLGSDKYFRKKFILPLEAGDNPELENDLQRLIYPFKLRRTKKVVLHDLPDKIEDIRHCTLSQEQVRLYREIVEGRAKPLIGQLENDSSPIPFLHVFATLQLLKQVCDHPAVMLKSPDYKKYESGKFELLKQLIDEALGSGHKIVIFSQYVGMIKIINAYLAENGILSVCLTGQSKKRGKIVEEFQTNDNVKVFVGSLLAGGIGIDLTAASVVIHYDRWWNASKENQATDRVHRIGQKKFVQVIKLVTKGTLEEKIDRIIASKHKVFSKFLEKDEEIFGTLSRQELIDLLQ